MGQVSITGQLVGGQIQNGSFGMFGGFPQAIFTTNLALTPSPKPFSTASGVLQRRIATVSPDFAHLQGVGAGDAVARGDTLYLRSDSQILLQLSQIDPLNPGGPVLVRQLYVSGLVVLEFPLSSPLVLLEAQGAATLEYLVTGQ